MIVSLVKETRLGEKRVLLLPEHLKLLSGFCDLYVEKDAGEAMGISDNDYISIGATIVEKECAWNLADLVLKLKRPSLDEIKMMHNGSSIAAVFHAEVVPDLIDLLVKKKITSYSFEYFQDADGNFPLMSATGDISGKQAIIYAAYHLQSHIEGSGKMFASTKTVEGAKVAILGFGNVGESAARLALAMGAEVFIIRWGASEEAEVEINKKKVGVFKWSKKVLDEIIPQCDVVIGAIRVSTFDTPVFFGSSLLNKMKKGSVIVDVTAGYGAGYIEPSDKTTSLNEPYRIVNGIKIIKIRELPLGVHLTAAQQISAVFIPYIKKLVASLNKKDSVNMLTRTFGVITDRGNIVNQEIQKHYEIKFKE